MQGIVVRRLVVLFYFLSNFVALADDDLKQTCSSSFEGIPTISLREGLNEDDTVKKIGHACQVAGFFYIKDHDVPEEMIRRLMDVSREFFDLPQATKQEISMARGGKAWRGYFSTGDEVTSGIPDEKEGIYFGRDTESSNNRPLHGKNLYLNSTLGTEMRDLVDVYMAELEHLGSRVLALLIKSLGLRSTSDLKVSFRDPTILFRIFNYPPHQDSSPKFKGSYGVGKHSDYGYLTFLYQDMSGGLEVELANGSWIEAKVAIYIYIIGERAKFIKQLFFKSLNILILLLFSFFQPVENTFVVNIGDALDHATGGLFRSTPHRLRQRVGATMGRISMPFFFDPNYDSLMKSVYDELSEELQELALKNRRLDRWDGVNLTAFDGTNYGDYLMMKVRKVFPLLANDVL